MLIKLVEEMDDEGLGEGRVSEAVRKLSDMYPGMDPTWLRVVAAKINSVVEMCGKKGVWSFSGGAHQGLNKEQADLARVLDAFEEWWTGYCDIKMRDLDSK